MTDASEADRAAVEAAVRDYVDGWFLGDSERMARCLHPEFQKRRVDGAMPTGLLETTKPDMVDGAAQRLLPRYLAEHAVAYDPASSIITIEEISEGVASARCLSLHYLDLIHLAKTAEGWKLVNALWRRHDTPENDRLTAWMRRESPW